ncbi:GIY-YIG nuclease family protein [Falsiroseomonas sp. HW251]|uniref:GIY-YIG nuclease family protein n=1 Tax=Falsiroseomonas sp. HW251 TaxID=3390998 RepID=UPI003D318B06
MAPIFATTAYVAPWHSPTQALMRMADKMTGLVYVARNSRLRGLLKIGMTKRDDAQTRASDYGVQLPGSTSIVFSMKAENPLAAERCVHAALDARGLRDNGEWFRCSLEQAVAVIEAAVTGRRAPGHALDEAATGRGGYGAKKRRVWSSYELAASTRYSYGGREQSRPFTEEERRAIDAQRGGNADDPPGDPVLRAMENRRKLHAR